MVREGTDLLIVSTGIIVGNAVTAAVELEGQGISAAVLDVHTLKPFDAEALVEIAARYPAVLVVKEHNTEGGLGTMTAEALALAGGRVPLLKHGIPDEYCIIGPPAHCYAYYGLDAPGIAATAARFLDRAGSWWDGVERTCWTEDDRAELVRASRATDRTPPDFTGCRCRDDRRRPQPASSLVGASPASSSARRASRTSFDVLMTCSWVSLAAVRPSPARTASRIAACSFAE